jgi:hypothetical protein
MNKNNIIIVKGTPDNTIPESSVLRAVNLCGQFLQSRLLVEHVKATKDQIEECAEKNKRIIFIGKSDLMHKTCKKIFTIERAGCSVTMRLKHPFRHHVTIPINPDYATHIYMVYENRHLDGRHVVALWGSTDKALDIVTDYFKRLCQESYTPDQRMVMAAYTEGDIITTHAKTHFMFDRSE